MLTPNEQLNNDQLNTINDLVNQINAEADRQYALTADADDEDGADISLYFVEHTGSSYVAVYDSFQGNTIESIDYPLTQLPEILKLVKSKGGPVTDLLDAVAIVKVEEALRLLWQGLESRDFNEAEDRIALQADAALEYIKRTLKSRTQEHIQHAREKAARTQQSLTETFGLEIVEPPAQIQDVRKLEPWQIPEKVSIKR